VVDVFELVDAVFVSSGSFLDFLELSGVASEFFLSSFLFTPKVSPRSLNLELGYF
jgi:hypothetical protein